MYKRQPLKCLKKTKKHPPQNSINLEHAIFKFDFKDAAKLYYN